MIVVIDPELKKIFFDKVMEMNGNSPYQASKWLESVAYGEKAVLVSDQLDGYIERIVELENLSKGYKKSWKLERAQRMALQRKMTHVDEEVDSYTEEIGELRHIIMGGGLGKYLDE